MLQSLVYAASSVSISLLMGGSRVEASLGAGITLVSAFQFRHIGGITCLLVVCCYNVTRLYMDSRARLVCVDSNTVTDPVRRRLAVTIEKIVQRTPELSSPRYFPTLWTAAMWPNLLLQMAKANFDVKFRNKFRQDSLRMEDGGTVSVDWPDDVETDTLPPEAPIVIFLHTVTGSSSSTSHYTRAATRRGWRSCVFNRRGHGGMRLTSPKFNLMGDAEDTRLMVEHVMETWPVSSYLAMVGISAGSGLLITYLGKEGDKTPVRAAASLCPAWDVSQAFRRLSDFFPVVDKHLLDSCKHRFLLKNPEILIQNYPEAFEACSQARTVQEFFDGHHTFAGFKTMEEYYEDSNPMNWVDGIVRPVLVINSEDDMVCLPENIREDVVLSLGGALLLRTKRGTHIAYNEGLLGQGNYMSRVAMDFLESARTVECKLD